MQAQAAGIHQQAAVTLPTINSKETRSGEPMLLPAAAAALGASRQQQELIMWNAHAVYLCRLACRTKNLFNVS